MEKFRKEVSFARGLPKMYFSNGASGSRTRSTSHGGFDNDIHTMNDILQRVLGKKPERPFTKDDLKY
jgi:hypothetical protein